MLDDLHHSLDATAPGFGSNSHAAPPHIAIIELLDRAADAFNNNRTAAQDSIAQASALLKQEYNWADRWDGLPSTSQAVRGGLAPWQIRRVTKHVDTCLGSTIRTRDCAQIAKLSTSHFSRSFKISFGQTFFDYVLRCRTERVKEMMVMTDEPLSRIALDCGFADQAHLSRQFRRRVGSTPARWRRQRREARIAH
jgi:AraC-like DNA-binding protein